jgi:DNA-binding MarR family transcriptional regulator
MNESEIKERLELEKEISLFLSQCFLELDEGERQLMKRFGLTITQYWALVHLENEEGRSFTELADLLICDKSNVTSIVDKFEESGLAKRERGKAGDRRYVRIVLTPQGHQLRKVLISAQQHLLKQRFQHRAPATTARPTSTTGWHTPGAIQKQRSLRYDR